MNFDPSRLEIAQHRRRTSNKALAEACGITTVHLSRLRRGVGEPSSSLVDTLASSLRYPSKFFMQGPIEQKTKDEVSFRSLRKMSAAERNAAIALASLGDEVSRWVDERFNLPKAQVPDLRDVDPVRAADVLRREWVLGTRPVPSLLKLLESKGVRLFALGDAGSDVDAFSTWSRLTPFIFLSAHKSVERGVFDCAHELGHLVLHQHQQLTGSNEVEAQANRFAGAFLMPEVDLRTHLPRVLSAQSIIETKARWRVSAMALAYRAAEIGRLTEWQYRSVCIELARLGYRRKEEVGVEREMSTVWTTVVRQLWKEGVTISKIARDLAIPEDEIHCLVGEIIAPHNSRPTSFEPSLSVCK